MCFERKNNAPFPLESKRRSGLKLEDFRGVFENDDGGHRILEKAGIMSVTDAIASSNWPEIVDEEEESIPKNEFYSLDGFAGGIADIKGKPIIDFWNSSEDINVIHKFDSVATQIAGNAMGIATKRHKKRRKIALLTSLKKRLISKYSQKGGE